jgi:hypothetical protein
LEYERSCAEVAASAAVLATPKSLNYGATLPSLMIGKTRADGEKKMAEAIERRQSSFGRLRGKAAIITGAARGIGRAAAVAFAREGADVMGIDIAGSVSPTLEVEPATPEELAETGRLVEAAGTRWCEARLDQRDLPALRAAAAKARDLRPA